VPTASVFISSVQKELADERRAVKAFVEGDPLLRRYFTVFLFEDLPARDRRANEVYLDEVDRCAIYVGLFGKEYGFEDAEGVSPTEREFDRARARAKPRLIFVKGADDRGRHPKMQALIRKAGNQLIRRRFASAPELTASLYASLVEHLEGTGLLRTRPFDASACPLATLADVSKEKLRWFLGRARQERQFALAENTPPAEALAHLNLLDAGQPTHAAILLFGKHPQRFLLTSEVKCMHFHGTEVRKPIPSYQIYKGTVFDLVDQAVDFVMSKIARSVGTRAQGPEAPVEYELPRDAVAEAIVNAVAHRDYASNASVQVMLFSDRFEVWNPGELPPPLTMEKLRVPHASIPRNPLVADPLFLARYIEKAGTGTLDMITLCRAADLPEPEFRQDGGMFVQTLWRDWVTDEVLRGFELNERQKKAVLFVKTHKRIRNAEYQRFTGAIKKTASRDLEDLVERGIFAKVGTTGRGTYYSLARKGDIKGTKGTSSATVSTGTKEDKNGTKRTLGRRQEQDKNRTNETRAERQAAGKGSQRAQTAQVPSTASPTTKADEKKAKGTDRRGTKQSGKGDRKETRRP
jgi:predicted HTH transcriptional regulator